MPKFPPKPGRPALGDAKRLRLSMTLKPELVAQLERRAASLGVSSSRLVESLLQEGLKAEAQKLSLWQARLGVAVGQVEALCQALGVKRLAIFGSVLRDDFGPESDVDVLVDFKPGTIKTLFDRGHAQMEFERLFKRSTDMVELRLIENPIRRKEILATQEVVYEA